MGLNVTMEPDGWPLRLSVTAPSKPFIGPIVTVYVAVPPRLTDCEAGLTPSVKSGGTLVTVRLAVLLRPALAAVTVNVPAVGPAVTNPDWSIVVSPGVTDQVKVALIG